MLIMFPFNNALIKNLVFEFPYILLKDNLYNYCTI